jgi:D-alanyl-D-alanine carboxypeptidase/D-alanyl-D-alanine-endopeptidase (penicillin-binding protein 4)
MRKGAIILLVVAFVAAVASPASARPIWKKKIDRAVRGHRIGVVIKDRGDTLYSHAARRRRIPASNQKLMMSASLLKELGPRARIATKVVGPAPLGGVIDGNLWILGRGDPTLGTKAYAKSFEFRATRISRLVRQIRAAGIVRVGGRVMGSTNYFARDWTAPGWKSNFPAEHIPLPSALSYNGNEVGGRHISDPELRVARDLTRRLERSGIKVTGRPGAGTAPRGLTKIARVRSEPLRLLLKVVNRRSSNFFAEVLGKRVGVETHGGPGTIAKGATAQRALMASLGEEVETFDSSGLSYANRVSPRAIVRLLSDAARGPWGGPFRTSLAAGGEGTLEDRLHDVRLRAKTGTLEGVSALSGYLWLRRTTSWAEFSILSRGMPKYIAASIEDRIARIATRSAH